MVKLSGSIVDDGHDVRVIVFVIIIKRVKEDSETNPFVRASEHLSIIISFVLSEPECLKEKLKIKNHWETNPS